MANAIYVVGPWQLQKVWEPHAYEGPEGWFSTLDFASVPQCGESCWQHDGSLADSRPVGFFALSPGSRVSSDYFVLGSGDVREIRPSGKDRQTLKRILGVEPTGDTLVDWLWSVLMMGAPDGQERWKPVMPTHDGWLNLALGHDHGRVRRERFLWNRSPHMNRIRDVVRHDLVQQAKSSPPETMRKVLGYQTQKYFGRWDHPNFRELLTPNEFDIAPLKPETTIGDTFVESSDTDLSSHTATGPNGGFGWTELVGDFDVIASIDQLYGKSHKTWDLARADTDLSSVDHYSEAYIDLYSAGAAYFAYRAITRKDSTATQTYYATQINGVGVRTVYLLKVVSGSGTTLDSWTTPSWAYDYLKVQCDGSSITGYWQGTERVSATDTSITTGTRAGIGGYNNTYSTYDTLFDNFEAADLDTSSTATVSPVTVSWTVVEPTATAVVTASVSPVTLSWSVVGPEAGQAATATVSPVTVSWSMVAPTATAVVTVNVSPATVSWSVVAPTPAIQIAATVSPVVLTWTVVDPTATVAFVVSASVLPVTLSWSVVAPTAQVIITATMTPAAVFWSVVEPTATVRATATVSPVGLSWAVVDPEAGHVATATVSPLSLSWSATQPTATITATATVSPVTGIWSVTDPTATIAVNATVTSLTVDWSVTTSTATVTQPYGYLVADPILKSTLTATGMIAPALHGKSKVGNTVQGEAMKAPTLRGAAKTKATTQGKAYISTSNQI